MGEATPETHASLMRLRHMQHCAPHQRSCELTSGNASQVRQVLPTFEAPTPAAGALPLAYPNCPMRALTVAVWKAGAQLVLNLKFGNTPGDALSHPALS